MASGSSFESTSLWRAAIFKACVTGCLDLIHDLMLRAPSCGLDFRLDFHLDSKALTPLIAACLAKKSGLVERLLELGAHPDFPDESGWTALHWACRSDRHDLVTTLLNHGANPNAIFIGEDASCLHFCAQSSSLDCALLLVARGANINALDHSTQATARHWGAHDASFSRILGPSPLPAPDGCGRGVLHWAVRNACSDAQALESCQLWVGLGASPHLQDHLGLSPSDAARERSLIDCASYLDAVVEQGSLNMAVINRPQRLLAHTAAGRI